MGAGLARVLKYYSVPRVLGTIDLLYIYILEKIYEKFLMHFKMNRHTLEILGRNYGGSVWRKWMAILGTGDCHARHFEAANEMGTQRRKTGR